MQHSNASCGQPKEHVRSERRDCRLRRNCRTPRLLAGRRYPCAASSVFLPQTFEFSVLFRNGWIQQGNQMAFHFGMQRLHRILRNRRVDIYRDTVFGDDLCDFASVEGHEGIHNSSIHLFCDFREVSPVDVQVLLCTGMPVRVTNNDPHSGRWASTSCFCTFALLRNLTAGR